MTALEFLSPRPADTERFTPRLRSPLERALRDAPPWLRDLSLELAKFEVRGTLDGIEGDLVAITPRRGLVLAPYADAAAVEERLRRGDAVVIDVTGALAALRVGGANAPQLLRRLTELDLDALPAVGAVAHVPALVRGGGELFDLFWPQEYGHYLAHVVVDAAEGLR